MEGNLGEWEEKEDISLRAEGEWRRPKGETVASSSVA